MKKKTEKLHGTFTTIMAGSALPWLQIRSDRSSDALSHHCLLRLQPTLLTGLSCPAETDTFKTDLELYCEISKLAFKGAVGESGGVI